MSDDMTTPVVELWARDEHPDTGLVPIYKKRIAELESQLANEQAESEHWNNLAVVDPGANPPVTWRERAEELVRQLAKAREHIQKLSKRIHTQRVALRENWEIIEMRASYPRRQHLVKRMLNCAIDHNKRRKEAEYLLAEARLATREAFRAAYWTWCGPANDREMEVAIADEERQWQEWHASYSGGGRDETSS